MAKKASTTGAGKPGGKAGAAAKKKKATASASGAKRTQSAKASKQSQSRASKGAKKETSKAADAVVKLLESPLVIDLLAVGASAALATLAEHRFSRRDRDAKVNTGRAVKAAGTAAASAVGRRLVEEWDELRRTSADETKAGGGS